MSSEQSTGDEQTLQDGAFLSGVLQLQCLTCLQPFDYQFTNEDHTTLPEADSVCPHCEATIPIAVLVGFDAGQLELLPAVLEVLWSLRGDAKRLMLHLRDLLMTHNPMALDAPPYRLVGGDGGSEE